MKIPETIQIAGIEYSINQYDSLSPEMSYGGAVGYNNPTDGFININKELKQDIKEVTLIHELTHAVLNALFISDEAVMLDERFVESFSQLFYQALKQL